VIRQFDLVFLDTRRLLTGSSDVRRSPRKLFIQLNVLGKHEDEIPGIGVDGFADARVHVTRR
jgi:hypothetical protein